MSPGRGGFLGLGPVFAYDWLIASRRWQGYAVRSLFVVLLLSALLVVWGSRNGVQAVATFRGLAAIGEEFFIALVGTQLTLVLLAAPAATAGAICLDRARGTMTHLLVTDLSDREIVLGKLAARLIPVVGLVGCTLPVMAILTLLGGVDPDALFGAFLVTLGTAVLGCSLALGFSLIAGKTHEALLGTYAVWGLWLLGAPMFTQLNRMWGGGWGVSDRTVNPYALAFAPYWWPGSVGWGDYLGFLAVTCAISGVLAAVAVWRLRTVCTRERVRKPSVWNQHFAHRMTKVGILRDLTRRLPGPTLDFNPVLWREWHRSRSSLWARIVGVVFVALATTFSLLAVVAGSGSALPAWTNGLQASIGMLLLSVTAATSLAEERVRGSLDVLMTTPLSTREILVGKWLGTFRLVPPLAILPCLIILCAPANLPERAELLLLTIAFILCSGAATTSVGLALATWCSRLGRAVGLTVTLYVAITVGWMFLVLAIEAGPPEEYAMMGSIFFWVGMLTDVIYERPAALEREYFDWGAIWIYAYALAAVVFFVLTLATFNHCLGRVGSARPPRGRRKREITKRETIEEAVGESVGVA